MDERRVERLVQLDGGVAEGWHEAGGETLAPLRARALDHLAQGEARHVLHHHNEAAPEGTVRAAVSAALLAALDDSGQVRKASASALGGSELAVCTPEARGRREELANEGPELRAVRPAIPHELRDLARGFLEHALDAIRVGRDAGARRNAGARRDLLTSVGAGAGCYLLASRGI